MPAPGDGRLSVLVHWPGLVWSRPLHTVHGPPAVHRHGIPARLPSFRAGAARKRDGTTSRHGPVAEHDGGIAPYIYLSGVCDALPAWPGPFRARPARAAAASPPTTSLHSVRSAPCRSTPPANTVQFQPLQEGKPVWMSFGNTTGAAAEARAPARLGPDRGPAAPAADPRASRRMPGRRRLWCAERVSRAPVAQRQPRRLPCLLPAGRAMGPPEARPPCRVDHNGLAEGRQRSTPPCPGMLSWLDEKWSRRGCVACSSGQLPKPGEEKSLVVA